MEYLNAITRDEVSIVAFEATRVAHGEVEILMPWSSGLNSLQSGPSPSDQLLDPQEFLTAAGNDGAEVAEAARLFLDEVRAAGFTLFNGTATHPNVIIGRPDAGYWPVSVYSNPVRPQDPAARHRRRPRSGTRDRLRDVSGRYSGAKARSGESQHSGQAHPGVRRR